MYMLVVILLGKVLESCLLNKDPHTEDLLMTRESFMSQVQQMLTQEEYDQDEDPLARYHDLLAACRIKDRQQSLTILLGGTSGCGKSTLASLLSSR